MAHSLSWIDSSEFEALVEATAWRRPAPRSVPVAPVLPEPSGGMLAAPEPAAESPAPVPSPRGPLRPARSVTVAARPAPPSATPEPPPPPPPYTPAVRAFEAPPGGSLEERLEHLIAWATEDGALVSATVVDDEGLLVAGAQHSSRSATLSALAHATSRSRWLDVIGAKESGQLTVRAGEQTHVLIWEPTSRGRLLLSLRATATPSQTALDALGTALRGAL